MIHCPVLPNPASPGENGPRHSNVAIQGARNSLMACGTALRFSGSSAFTGWRLSLKWSKMGGTPKSSNQWISLRENLQETKDFPIKYGAFL